MASKGCTVEQKCDWWGPDDEGNVLMDSPDFACCVVLTRQDLEAMLASYDTKPVGSDEEESE